MKPVDTLPVATPTADPRGAVKMPARPLAHLAARLAGLARSLRKRSLDRRTALPVRAPRRPARSRAEALAIGLGCDVVGRGRRRLRD